MSQDFRDSRGMLVVVDVAAGARHLAMAAGPVQFERYSPEVGEVERFRVIKARAEAFIERLVKQHQSEDLWQDDSFIVLKDVDEPVAEIVVQLLKKRQGWDAHIRHAHGGIPGLIDASRGGGGGKEIRIRNPIFLLDGA